MEITFQNRREDFQAFYDYMVRGTEQGKKVSQQVFRARVIWIVVYAALLGSIMCGASSNLKLGLGITVLILLASAAIWLLISGFKPLYHTGVQVYKNQEKDITPTELQVFQLPRTITIDDDWLEVRSSEAIHRWRWRRVDQIGLTSEFVFIHVGNCPVVYVPKRDFSSEQSFVEFGKKLVELKEKSKGQPIGAE